MMRPISVQLSPTIFFDDVLAALSLLFSFHRLKNGPMVKALEGRFQTMFHVATAVAFNSGRSAELAILQCLGIGRGDEVLIQAFTCVAVPNSILWAGAQPVYVDVDTNGCTMSVADLERKITKKTKAVIVQHTFGYPNDMEKIYACTQKHGLFLIEDCAHSLGNRDRVLLGTYGITSFFSFGRDKVISSVFGGMAITNDPELGEKLRNAQEKLSMPKTGWILQQLLHPVFFAFILPLYRLYIGKMLLVVLQKMHLLSKPVDPMECQCLKPSNYPQKMPNALASLALHQLDKLPFFQKKRTDAAMLYREGLKSAAIKFFPDTREPLIRFSIRVSDASLLVSAAKKRGILLGRWYSHVVDPEGTNLLCAGYERGSCPSAELLAQEIVNLPTSPVLAVKEIKKVISFIQSYYEKD